MQLILQELDDYEMQFLFRLLNSAGACVELFSPAPNSDPRFPKSSSSRFLSKSAFVSPQEAIWLDRKSARLKRAYERGKVREKMRRTGAWFANSGKHSISGMQQEWTIARVRLLDAVVTFRDTSANFIQWPSIVGLPAHHPAVLVNDPCDLVGWMTARGMANEQLKRFVKCARCGKFGLRRRAKKDAKFCSLECQGLANNESRKLKPVHPSYGQISPPRIAVSLAKIR
jgi:hypothetical protein